MTGNASRVSQLGQLDKKIQLELLQQPATNDDDDLGSSQNLSDLGAARGKKKEGDLSSSSLRGSGLQEEPWVHAAWEVRWCVSQCALPERSGPGPVLANSTKSLSFSLAVTWSDFLQDPQLAKQFCSKPGLQIYTSTR